MKKKTINYYLYIYKLSFYNNNNNLNSCNNIDKGYTILVSLL